MLVLTPETRGGCGTADNRAGGIKSAGLQGREHSGNAGLMMQGSGSNRSDEAHLQDSQSIRDRDETRAMAVERRAAEQIAWLRDPGSTWHRVQQA